MSLKQPVQIARPVDFQDECDTLAAETCQFLAGVFVQIATTENAKVGCSERFCDRNCAAGLFQILLQVSRVADADAGADAADS